MQASVDNDIQTLFANGLLWCYGFHHEEAQRHFQQLLLKDRENLLGLWGLAYASAPFYNRPWCWFTNKQKVRVAKRGHSCIEKALTAQNNTESQICVDLIHALSALFRSPIPASDEVFIEYQCEYADRMVALLQRYPDHADITTLTVEALLNCTPWQLWDTGSRSKAIGSRVNEALELLQPLLADTHPDHAHPGVLHLHIHALEMSPYPEAAANSAEKIRQLVVATRSQDKTRQTDSVKAPASLFPPHLPHMASHIDVLRGDYRKTIDINRIAADADTQLAVADGEFYQISRLHNVHMLLYAAMMAGRHADAVDARQRLESLATSFYASDSAPFLKVSIEGFFANRLHASVRFGSWKAILQETENSSNNKNYNAMHSLPFASAMQSYTVGVALANSAEPHKAETELEHFRQLRSAVPNWYLINNNPARDILAVAELMLTGEHHYHLGNIEEGLDYLRNAVDACDRLAYCEPRAWMHPPRHALGALLLEHNQLDEAKQVYETDLGFNGLLSRCQQNPKNIWALQGLVECYERLSENVNDEIQQQQRIALAYADIPVTNSCFCRSSS